MKKLILLSLALLSTVAVQAQKKGTKPAPATSFCNIAKANTGERIKDGDVVFADLTYCTEKDSMLFNSKQMLGQPVQLLVGKADFKNDLNTGLKTMTVGDSAVMLISADSLFLKTFRQARPPFIPAGSNLKFYVKVTKVSSQDELIREQQAASKAKEESEMVNLEKFISDNKLNVTKTESGLRYLITQAASGPQPQAGQKVVVHYTGRLLNGKKFDSSVDRNEPFQFTIGQGQVIRGWDEGIALLHKGEKATLYIPSSLGYGAQGAGGSIGPYEPLIFDVELIDIK